MKKLVLLLLCAVSPVVAKSPGAAKKRAAARTQKQAEYAARQAAQPQPQPQVAADPVPVAAAPAAPVANKPVQSTMKWWIAGSVVVAAGIYWIANKLGYIGSTTEEEVTVEPGIVYEDPSWRRDRKPLINN